MIQAGKTLGLTVGIVVDRDDKDGKLGRVKVKLPLEKDRVTDWCRVLMPYGGDKHGAYVVPELEDEVVLGYYVGDPKILFVLGSIYSKKRPPPTEEIDERRFHTRGKTEVVFSDVKEGEEYFELKTNKKQRIRVHDGDEDIMLENEHQILVSQKKKQILVKTKEGHQLLIDDGAGEISLKVKAGHLVKVTNSGDISVTGKTVKVTASSIDLVKG